MIDRQFGKITFECDGCDTTLATDEEEWTVAFDRFRQEDWKAERVGGEWVHLCPKCQHG